MDVLLLCKGRLEAVPPVMTVGKLLAELGHSVTVITSRCDPIVEAELEAAGVTVHGVLPRIHSSGSGVSGKLWHWSTFRREAWRHISADQPNRLLWIATGDTAIALGGALRGRRYVLGLLELYDDNHTYRLLLKKFVHAAACVVVPEMLRASVLRSWYGLPTTPLVLPNKPASHPRRPRLPVHDERAAAILAEIPVNHKIVLYQGGIRPYSELSYVAEAVQDLGAEWHFVVMGAGRMDYLKALQRDHPGIIYVPHVPAPYHLEITSHAHVGVITYSYDNLNSVFCAPNKMWELGGFGVPMICNDLPPLLRDVHDRGAGLCVDIRRADQIKTALTAIDRDRSTFGRNANALFDSIDMRQIMRTIVDSACSSL